MTSFPVRPEMLTTEWLGRILRSAGHLVGDQGVRGFSVESIGDGVGMVGRVIRVGLEYRGHGVSAPPSLVIKFAHEVAANRAVGMKLGIYQREVIFYNEIARVVAVPKPACYFAAVAEETGEFIVVLEDMVRYRQGDQLTGVSLDEAKHVVDALAPLHAAFWGNTDQELLHGVMRVDSTWTEPHMQLVGTNWESCAARFGHCIPEVIARSLPAYVRALRPFHTVMGNRTQTLLHGDPRMDNLMFNDGVDGPPVILLDWQTVLISNPLHDVALMLSMSATIEARRTMEEELIRYYHARLMDHGVTGYCLQQCREDYDLAVPYMLSVALILGGAFNPANERGRRLAEAVISRSCAAILDRGVLDRVTGPVA